MLVSDSVAPVRKAATITRLSPFVVPGGTEIVRLDAAAVSVAE